MTVRKRFDKELYDQVDALAKNKCIEIISNADKRYNIEIKENPKQRGVDLLVYKNGEHIANVETEIKKVWKQSQFQYDNVQFPERKRKFCELDKPTIFIMFNFDQSAYLAVTDKDMLNSPSVEVPNSYCFKGEYFFQVPIKKVYMNDVKSALKKIGVF